MTPDDQQKIEPSSADLSRSNSKTNRARSISIVVPIFNEADNLVPLVARIDTALRKEALDYEIIFIDDHSLDHTKFTIDKLSLSYPIRMFEKQGKQGKAFSLLEGFRYCMYDVVCMIDGDLQYPPEVIPAMHALIDTGTADIVVGDREEAKTSLWRRIASNGFRLIFGRLLFGLRQDIQSGLKVFRRNLLTYVPTNPSAWTFDLEFLVNAIHANRKIVSIPITFSKRSQGVSKIHLLRSAWEIGTNALSLKLRQVFLRASKSSKPQEYEVLSETYSTLSQNESAAQILTPPQKLFGLSLATALTATTAYSWHDFLVGVITIATILYFVDLCFNLFMIYRSLSRSVEITVPDRTINTVRRDWPRYTIFCPLYKEVAVLPQFIAAMEQLNYPKEQLEVMLLLEEDDPDTIQAASLMNLPSNFQIVIVPNSQPKTKPKACNYGLKFARGQYTVIYDAEDIPEPAQLKKAVLAFEQIDKTIICVQAKLNYYNPKQNFLTKLFTLEYSLWFDLILTGIQSIEAPIPLGGTSNHFITKKIREIGGWDAYNVTEDADLGMRIAKRGYRTAILDSTTMEEANSQLKNWFKQRSRWVKGWIVTYLVHLRNLRDFTRNGNKLNLLTYHLISGGRVFSVLTNPIMWTLTITFFAFRDQSSAFIESLYLTPIFYLGIIVMILGNFLYIYYYLVGVAKRNQWEMVKYGIFVPIYWIMISIAGYYAVWELLRKPFHWNKTKHGLHLQNVKDRKNAELLLKNN